jgi:hypothetical protein
MYQHHASQKRERLEQIDLPRIKRIARIGVTDFKAYYRGKLDSSVA